MKNQNGIQKENIGLLISPAVSDIGAADAAKGIARRPFYVQHPIEWVRAAYAEGYKNGTNSTGVKSGKTSAAI